jgi:hypothetical protein
MACQPKRNIKPPSRIPMATVALSIPRPATLAPTASPAKSCLVVAAYPPTTGAPISNRLTPFSHAEIPSAPDPDPFPAEPKLKTIQKPQQSNHIKPHQPGGKERRFAIRLPPLVPWPFNFGLWPLDFGLWIADRPKQSDGFRRSRPHTIRPQNDASR